MRRVYLFFALSASVFLWGDFGGKVESYMLLPPEFHVGDVVELRAVLVPDPGVTLSMPAHLPDSFWLRTDSLSLRELSGGRYELRMLFASYYPGTRTLPPLALGGMTLDKLRIHTVSVLGDSGTQLSPIRPPMFLPGTLFLLVLLAAVVLGGPLFGIFFYSYLKKAGREFLVRMQLRLPFRRFNRLVRELNTSFFSTGDREFYFTLSEGLRNYLSERTGEDFLTVTLEEIGMLIPEYLEDFENQKQMIRLLHYADLIKFSGGGSILEKKRRDLDDALALVKSIEDHYRVPVKEAGRAVI